MKGGPARAGVATARAARANEAINVFLRMTSSLFKVVLPLLTPGSPHRGRSETERVPPGVEHPPVARLDTVLRDACRRGDESREPIEDAAAIAGTDAREQMPQRHLVAL